MCGIAGIVHPQGQAIAEQERQVTLMTRAIAHRGPDGAGHFADEQAALGHRRLAILDLSDAAAQPMHSDDGRLVLALTVRSTTSSSWQRS